MNLLQRISQSVRYWSNMKYRTKYINPEIRELLEDFHQKKRNLVNKSLNDEEKQINILKNSYEFKCFEHFQKVDYLKTMEKSSDFLKYCDFKIFFDKKRWTRSFFFIKFFHTPKDFIFTKFNKILLLILALFSFKLGFINGFKDCKLYDEVKENVKDIRAEDELLSLLMDRGLPVLVLYYIAGDIMGLEMQKAQGQFIEQYGENYVTMAKVNCKYNLDLCIKKVNYLVMPQWEIMYPPFIDKDENGKEVKRFPIVPCKNNRSLEGIEGFLMEQGIVPDKYSPLYVVNKSLRKYL